MSITKDQIIEAVASMSVMEIVKLIAAMEEKFGISSATTASYSHASATETNEVDKSLAPAEEKTEFEVILKAIGANKIAVIKTVRSTTGLGLKEAKDLVESAPTSLKEGVSKDAAEALKKTLEEVGAEVEIK